MKKSHIAKMVKQIEQDCKAATRLSLKAQKRLNKIVDAGIVLLPPSSERVVGCVAGLTQVELACHDSSVCSKAAQKTIASFKRTVEYNYAIHRLIEAAKRVRDHRMSVLHNHSNLANLPPEAFGTQILDKTGGTNGRK